MSYIPSRDAAATGTVPEQDDQCAIFRAHGLVSLLDMFKFFAANQFAHDLHALARLRADIETIIRDNPALAGEAPSADVRQRAQDRLPHLVPHLEACGFTRAESILHKSSDDLLNLATGQLARDLEQFQRAIELDLGDQAFVAIPLERLKWCDQEQGFGPDVAAAFPSATKDAMEAGNCYGAGAFTASVYHATCALEVALKALARHLHVPWSLSRMTWGDALKGLAKAIQELPWKTTIQRTRREFFEQAAMDFRYFKDVWRDKTMHARLGPVDEEKARSVLTHARSFMQHLATRLREPRAKRRDLA